MGLSNTVKDIANSICNSLNKFKHQSKQITELKSERLNLLEKLKQSNKIIVSLQSALKDNGEMVSEYCAYWRKDGLGNIIEGPFCLSCFVTRNTLQPLVQVEKPDDEKGDDWEWVQCTYCRVPFRQRQVGQYIQTHSA